MQINTIDRNEQLKLLRSLSRDLGCYTGEFIKRLDTITKPTGGTFLSIPMLAKLTGWGCRSVRRDLDELVRAGFVKRVRVKPGGQVYTSIEWHQIQKWVYLSPSGFLWYTQMVAWAQQVDNVGVAGQV